MQRKYDWRFGTIARKAKNVFIKQLSYIMKSRANFLDLYLNTRIARVGMQTVRIFPKFFPS